VLHVIHRINSDYFPQQQQWASVCNGTHFFLCEVGKEMRVWSKYRNIVGWSLIGPQWEAGNLLCRTRSYTGGTNGPETKLCNLKCGTNCVSVLRDVLFNCNCRLVFRGRLRLMQCVVLHYF
jgi:hypothetical protein